MKRKLVDFEENEKDLEAAIMAEAGFCGRLISTSTGYSRAQVYYRVRRAGLKISDYRNGYSWVAKRVRAELLPGAKRFELARISKREKPVSRWLVVDKNKLRKKALKAAA